MQVQKGKSNNNVKYSVKVRAGRRTYFFDIKENRKGENYIVISESRKTENGIRKQMIMVFPEDVDKFYKALEEVRKNF